MALVDVKQYYYTMLNQYIESKNDLADFEKALKDGHITEDQLEDIKYDVEQLKINVDRLQYIMYLFSLPNRKEKKKRFKDKNQKLEAYFNNIHADTKSLVDENEDVLAHLRAEIKKLEVGN